jgi:hypothetical protein
MPGSQAAAERANAVNIASALAAAMPISSSMRAPASSASDQYVKHEQT